MRIYNELFPSFFISRPLHDNFVITHQMFNYFKMKTLFNFRMFSAVYNTSKNEWNYILFYILLYMH